MQMIMSRPGEQTTLNVDLWQLELGQISVMADWLSASEQAWLEKLGVFNLAGQQFRQSRSLLRWVLSHYVIVPPAAVELCFSPTGKPHLDRRVHDPAWQFSWSHAGEMAVAAVTKNCPVGVDIEQIKLRPRAKKIAQRFFSQTDQARLKLLPEPNYTQEFLSCWTGLEARIKAVGGQLFQSESCPHPYQTLNFMIGSTYVGAVVALTDQPVSLNMIYKKVARIG
ncbi:4'-phosphopantetheinyl transferase superfamily protein [Synechococcus sp. PCC 6312]|uniref:4'-phosphopantetheinyl transferase family protein n=1 Tax=Synechococcus sp. (strain ATCC 27167 / PCC 6312) TaxID=195253 RepID=UPI00029F4AE2|nr:4'-phosphopantetheinyl transferase superfamily protein [Synechococcus sp. PCC 6312]AFY60262.1 phosphopantetheinyl transferase [Synechococcus sp. PCC 6312]